MTALLAALAGANLIYGAGMTESGVTFDYAQYVLDNDIAGLVKQAIGGVPVNDETLAVDDIETVGPFGDFMSLSATLQHMHDLSTPRFMDRRVREEWEAAGAEDAYTVAREAAQRILAEHRPEPLPDEVQAQVDAVVRDAETHAGLD